MPFEQNVTNWRHIIKMVSIFFLPLFLWWTIFSNLLFRSILSVEIPDGTDKCIRSISSWSSEDNESPGKRPSTMTKPGSSTISDEQTADRSTYCPFHWISRCTEPASTDVCLTLAICLPFGVNDWVQDCGKVLKMDFTWPKTLMDAAILFKMAKYYWYCRKNWKLPP